MDDTLIRIMKLGSTGFTCSQILVLMALEDAGDEDPALVRAMEGLAYGCGGGRATCGALTGGCCVIALFAGKGTADEDASKQLPLMLQELSDWFMDAAGLETGETACEIITGENGPAASRQKCGMLVADTYNKAVEILARNGFPPYGLE